MARQLRTLTGASYMTCLQALRATCMRIESGGETNAMVQCREAVARGDHIFFGLRRGGDAPPARGEAYERVGGEDLGVDRPQH